MALINTDPRNLVARQFFAESADTRSPLVDALTGTIKNVRGDITARKEAKNISAALSGKATPDQLAKMFAADPDQALKILQGAGAVTQQGQQKLANTAFRIQSIKNPQQRNAAIAQVAGNIQQSGGDPSAFAALLNASPEQQDTSLQALQMAALSVKEREGIRQADERTALDARRTAAQERNVSSQIAARGVAAGQASQRFDIARETLEIRREESRQRSLDRQLANETNQLKRDELQNKINASKRKEAQAKRDVKFQADSAIQGATDIIETSDRLLAGESLEQAAGVSSLFPTFPGSKAADFEAQLETFKSQSFLNGVEKMKGLGALGEKEGQKIQDAAGSLNLNMSDTELRKEINRIRRGVEKARVRLEKKFGVSQSPSLDGGITLETLTGEDILNMPTEQLESLLEQ